MVSRRTCTLLFCFLAGLFASTRGTAQQIAPCAKWELIPQQAQAKETQADSFTMTSYDVSYYECHWNVNPEKQFISGHVKVQFKPIDGQLFKMYLDLHGNLKVDSILYH